jgi:hypothetical protein
MVTCRLEAPNMSKRNRSRDIESIFDQIKVKLNENATAFTPDIQQFTEGLNKLKETLLGDATPKTIAAGDFTMEMAIVTFGLQYAESTPESLWRIEDIPETQQLPTSSFGKFSVIWDFAPIMSIDAILVDYAQTVDRSSEAACRTPIDLILIQCVAELVSILAFL